MRRCCCRRIFARKFDPAVMTASAQPDIAKLRIDRSLAPVRASRRRKWLWLGGVTVVAAAGAAWYAAQPHPVTV